MGPEITFSLVSVALPTQIVIARHPIDTGVTKRKVHLIKYQLSFPSIKYESLILEQNSSAQKHSTIGCPNYMATVSKEMHLVSHDRTRHRMYGPTKIKSGNQNSSLSLQKMAILSSESTAIFFLKRSITCRHAVKMKVTFEKYAEKGLKDFSKVVVVEADIIA